MAMIVGLHVFITITDVIIIYNTIQSNEVVDRSNHAQLHHTFMA